MDALGGVLARAVQARSSAAGVLQRLRAEDETAYKQLCYAIEDIEHHVSLLQTTQAGWNAYHVGVTLLGELRSKVDPLVMELQALRTDVFDETEPDAKLKQASRTLVKARKALDAIIADGQDEDREKIAEAYKQGRAERVARMNKEFATAKAAVAAVAFMEAAKVEAAAAAERKRLDAEELVRLSAIYAPSVGGPAYARPANGDIPQFREYVRLRHPVFDELSEAQLKLDICPLYLLTCAQIERVEDRAGRWLKDWKAQNTPNSRRAALGFDRWLAPTKAFGLTPELGGEIFADWVVANPGHGFTTGKLLEIWSFVMRMKGSPFMSITTNDSRTVYQYKPGQRVETKIVTTSNDAVLITCYDVR